MSSTPTSRPPTCPEHLDDEAKREWRRIIREMPGGMIDRLDRGVLAVHCMAWSRLIHAELELAKTGPVTKSPSGYEIVSAWVTIVSQSVKQLNHTSAELGLTPVSRARIKRARPKLLVPPSGRRTVGA